MAGSFLTELYAHLAEGSSQVNAFRCAQNRDPSSPPELPRLARFHLLRDLIPHDVSHGSAGLRTCLPKQEEPDVVGGQRVSPHMGVRAAMSSDTAGGESSLGQGFV